MHGTCRSDRKSSWRKFTCFSELWSLFAMAQEVILSLKAIQVPFEMNTVNWVRTPSWKCTLANDKPLQWSKAKACVFPDSMLCLHGRCQPYPESAEALEGEELTGVWFLLNFVSLAKSMANRWCSSGRFSQGTRH